MTGRRADKAGTWYAGTADKLGTEVDACVRLAETRYGLESAAGDGTPVAVVAPHAGLAYSGPIAAAAFELVRRRVGKVDSFVVFGACHRVGLDRPAVWNAGPWETPLGAVDIDRDLADSLIREGVGAANPAAHLGDNAIELQTPFIKRLFPDARMVPVAMSFFPDSWRTGEKAAALAARTGKTVIAVASTDLTHYGAAFGVMPAGVGEPALAWIRENDRRFLRTLVDMDEANIVPTAERDGSACGAGAAAAAAGWASAMGCKKGRLLVHTNSHEIHPDGIAEHMVGYAALSYNA